MNKLIDNTVYQSNEILQHGISTLSTQATKILMMAISSIEAEDEPTKVYTLKLSDIINCLGTHYDGRIIADIKKCFDDIKSKPFWLQTNSTTEVQCSFFQKVWCIKDTDGTRFEVLFDSDCKPFLFGLKTNFTSYCLEDVLKMGSKFSIRLYGMLKSYLHTDSNGWEIIVKVDELKELLNATAKSYNNFNLFEEKVLSKAVKEINELTNINVGYIKAKTGRKITSILFTIKWKYGKN